MHLEVILHLLFLPPVLPKNFVKDFSGLFVVRSLKSYHTINLLDGVYGL